MKIKLWHIIAILVVAAVAYYAYAEYQRKRIQDQVNDMINAENNPATTSPLEQNKQAYAQVKGKGPLKKVG